MRRPLVVLAAALALATPALGQSLDDVSALQRLTCLAKTRSARGADDLDARAEGNPPLLAGFSPMDVSPTGRDEPWTFATPS